MSEKNILCWFRQDLRLTDNPALYHAAQHGRVIPFYIMDDAIAGEHQVGAAGRVWLHHALSALNKSLDGKLSIYAGDPVQIIPELAKHYKSSTIFWNHCYEPWRRTNDRKLIDTLHKQDVTVHGYHGSLLWEPESTKKENGTPYQVFTPFYRRGCKNASHPREPLGKPKHLTCDKDPKQGMDLADLKLLPAIRWDKKLIEHWRIGEEHAQQQLSHFIKEGLPCYKQGRDFPAKPYVSRLSPYLHWGQISPNQVWYTVRACGENNQIDHFCSELAWREFSYAQLYFHPDLPKKNLQTKFDAFPWQKNRNHLTAWQTGQTGIPMVDAGMRQLWQTGYMHNRVRMIVGSFLVKNLLLHWHHGEKWFWDCLFDADLANNSASWQWVAGCGADAAPYFRIFNPITQGKKFDPEGVYIRRFVPELSKLSNTYLFSPWEAPESVLRSANIVLGKQYPEPIVDIKHSRERALAAFKRLSKPSS